MLFDITTNVKKTFGAFVQEIGIKGGEGSLAKRMEGDINGTGIDVVSDFPWTLSPKEARSEVPYIRLIEFKCNESQINRQVAFYASLGAGIAEGVTGGKSGVLDVYKQVFSHEDPTNFSYKLPYFNESNFELSTPNWNKIDGAGEQVKDLISGGVGLLGGKEAGDLARQGMNLVQAGATALMQQQYPVVGILDRPRIFASHDERQITISFPLYNTFNEGDWSTNYAFLYQLMSQNLFNKRDYITGVAPVFYSVHIPGQYYCWASAMTNISVKNLGNIRMIGQSVVPDAYQVTLTLSEMIMPSKNQFEAVATGEAGQLVTTSTIAEAKSAAEAEKAAKVAAQNAEVAKGISSGTTQTAMQLGQGLGGPCWIARTVYGESNLNWIIFRSWLLDESPLWFKNVYIKYGEQFANFIKNKPLIKKVIRFWMDFIIKNK